MSSRILYLAGSACALLLMAAAVMSGDNDGPADSVTPTLSGVAAGMHFTDEKGNARMPSAEERLFPPRFSRTWPT